MVRLVVCWLVKVTVADCFDKLVVVIRKERKRDWGWPAVDLYDSRFVQRRIASLAN